MNTLSRSPIAFAVVLGSLFGACQTPPNVSSLDKYNCPADGGPCVLMPENGIIQGSVVYQGPRRGDAVLLLFATNALPPPDGTATAPAEVARIPSATLFATATAGSTGPFAAPYLFTEVPPGTYQIRAFLDLNNDFDPFADFTQSPHAGSPTGGTVVFDANGVPSLTSFTVGENQLVNEQVILGLEVPFDPPSFKFADNQLLSFPQDIDTPQQLVLQIINPGVPHANFADPQFTLQLDPSSTGQPQEPDADGLLAIYPQVNLLQTSALQGDGSFVAVSGAAAAVVPCKVLPISTWPLLISQPNGQFGVDQISVLVEPLAVTLDAAGTATPLAEIPAGKYELVVAERTGQIWTMPNSLGSQDPSSGFLVASQGAQIQFTAVVPPSGSIAGVVQYPTNTSGCGGMNFKPHNLIIQAFAGGPSLAPPLSAQLPAKVLSLPARFITVNSEGEAQFALTGLPAGQYVVEAIDDGDGNFNDVDILETPTRGDLVGGVFDANGNLKVITVGASQVAVEINFIAQPGVNPQCQGTPLDPPAFFIDESAGPAQIAQDARSTVRVEVQAQPVVFPALDQNAATTFFTVALVRDAAGNPVDSDADGLPDVWPRAFLVEIDPTDPLGLAPSVPTVALPVAVDPTPFLPALLAGDASTVLPTTRLSLIVRPAAVSLQNPAVPVPLAVMPAGRYKLILMNKTGQFWQVPNSSGSASLDPRAAALVNTASQSEAFTVVLPSAAVPAGEIDGTLTLAGITTFHTAYVFAYSVNDPPPPLGTGKPLSAALLNPTQFTTVMGNLQAAYALKALPGGNYYVTAVVDTRGDFAIDPQLFAAAPGPGDVLGGYVDTSNGSLPLKAVAVGSTAVTGIGVIAAASPALPPRPSFELVDGATPITSDLTTLFPDALTPQRITLMADTELNSSVVALDPEPAASAIFPVAYQACNGTVPVDADFDNLPDLYPRILVVRLADSDPSGLTIDPAGIAIPAAVDPTPFLATLGASCTTTAIAPTTSLSVILQPIAVHENADGSISQMPIPAGRYGIVLESKSGQVWRIPNELQPALLDPRSAATPAGAQLATQGVGIRVASQVPAALGGGITGQVSYVHQTAASIGNLIVAAYASEAPPPPQGVGRPLAVQVIPRAYVEQALGGLPSGSVPYLLSNLPPSGTDPYLVLAINDSNDEFSPSLDFMSTPPLGAQLAFAGGASPTPITVAHSVVTSTSITLDATSAAETIPFPRPAFDFANGTVLTVSSSNLNQTAPVVLAPYLPAGVPYPLPASAAFHPTVARDSSGAPYRLTGVSTCGSNLPWASSKVFVTPIDTGSRYVAFAQLNSCQFCQALTNTADCSAAPVAVPAALTTPITVVVTNVAIDPLTQAPAGVPLPTGHYAVTLIEETGQSWTVPNALASADPSQGAIFTVTP